MSIHTVKAESTIKEGMVVENKTRSFTIIADEPKALGGTDTGVSPVEMLLCSLGACQCLTARFFAKEHGIDLKDISISLEGDIDVKGVLGMQGIRPGFQEIRIKTTIKADAPREKIDAFIAFVQSRCPVGDTLMNGIKISRSHIIVE